MKINYVPFASEMIPDAGKLLAERHRLNRKVLPVLPGRFEDPQVTTKAVEALWQKQQGVGFAALKNGHLIAYLLGEMIVQPWGRCGYVNLPGYALAHGESTAVLQDLYAQLGDEWVNKGIFSHALYISAADTEIIQALFDLGFGKERVDALLDLGTMESPQSPTPAEYEIRQARKGDNEYLGRLSGVISRALASAPYWHPTIPEDYRELREGWAELADDTEWTIWLALENKEVPGIAGFRPEAEADTQMLAPAGTVDLSIAATDPSARGRGISTALTWHGLEQARKEGYAVCYTNWISPNLLASRFWPRFGFKDAAYRLAKRINPMISWTRTN